MVVAILIGVFIALVAAYILVIQFPGLVPAVGSAVDALIFYLGQAMDIVWLFVPKAVTIALMTLAIGVEVVVLGYKFVMWILRKIPMAGID